MTLTTLLLVIGLVSLVLTFFFKKLFPKRVRNIVVSYVQNFVGSLFIFSGFVKVIDPLGTAYKMEQYFAEFESVFSGSWLSFLAPLFPFISAYSIIFSVIMIVLEIVLGIFLITGSFRKFTTVALFLLILFFTFLTGFTYLTGYVPEGVNFFRFGEWGPYIPSNMKVTDCGCFGDFLVLEPKISFFKDIFLLFPSVYLLFTWRSMHVLLSRSGDWIVAAISTLVLVIFSMSNYKWDLPIVDFRPFAEGVDVRGRKALEEEAAANIEIIDWTLKNKGTGELITLSYNEYMANFKNYPKETFETVSQTYSEPVVKATKISEFTINDAEYYDVADDILAEEGYTFWIVCDKVKSRVESVPVMVSDTVFRVDSIFEEDVLIESRRVVDRIDTREITGDKYIFDEDFIARYRQKITPLTEHALESGIKVYTFIGGVSQKQADQIKEEVDVENEFYTADDILLKTIIRSNPGTLLLKDGKIIKKWHINKLPDFHTIKEKYIK